MSSRSRIVTYTACLHPPIANTSDSRRAGSASRISRSNARNEADRRRNTCRRTAPLRGAESNYLLSSAPSAGASVAASMACAEPLSRSRGCPRPVAAVHSCGASRCNRHSRPSATLGAVPQTRPRWPAPNRSRGRRCPRRWSRCPRPRPSRRLTRRWRRQPGRCGHRSGWTLPGGRPCDAADDTVSSSTSSMIAIGALSPLRGAGLDDPGVATVAGRERRRDLGEQLVHARPCRGRSS